MLKAILKEDLTFFFVSNILQGSITTTDIIASHFSDHSLRLLTLKLDEGSQKWRGWWKFNNSLVSDENVVFELKDHTAVLIETLNKENIFDDQIRQ